MGPCLVLIKLGKVVGTFFGREGRFSLRLVLKKIFPKSHGVSLEALLLLVLSPHFIALPVGSGDDCAHALWRTIERRLLYPLRFPPAHFCGEVSEPSSIPFSWHEVLQFSLILDFFDDVSFWVLAHQNDREVCGRQIVGFVGKFSW